MGLIGLGVLKSILRILILNVGVYIVDFGLDIKQYFYQKSRGHDHWAIAILVVTFLPNVTGFIYRIPKVVSLVERYARRKYETLYHMEWDRKNNRIYHVSMDETDRKWDNIPSRHKIFYISKIFLQHFCIAVLILLVSVPALCLSPFIVLALVVVECFGVRVSEKFAEYLDRNLYGWMIGYNRAVDTKAQNKQQRRTNDILFDLLFKDR